jgi:hypothetical protein
VNLRSEKLAGLIERGCLTLSFLAVLSSADTAQELKKKQPAIPGSMLSQGTMGFDTSEFTLTLVRSSQRVGASEPWLKTAVVLARAKWRAPRSARVSTLENNLTERTLLQSGPY